MMLKRVMAKTTKKATFAIRGADCFRLRRIVYLWSQPRQTGIAGQTRTVVPAVTVSRRAALNTLNALKM